MPADDNCPQISEEEANRIMQISLPIGNTVIMGSDSTSASGDAIIGTNISVSVNTSSKAEADSIIMD